MLILFLFLQHHAHILWYDKIFEIKMVVAFLLDQQNVSQINSIQTKNDNQFLLCVLSTKVDA